MLPELFQLSNSCKSRNALQTIIIMQSSKLHHQNHLNKRNGYIVLDLDEFIKDWCIKVQCGNVLFGAVKCYPLTKHMPDYKD